MGFGYEKLQRQDGRGALIIIVVDYDTYLRWQRKLDAYSVETNENLCVLYYPCSNDPIPDVLKTLYDSGKLMSSRTGEGRVLFRHPFDLEQYRVLSGERIVNDICVEKFVWFSYICYLLGASEVRVVGGDSEDLSRECEAKVGGGAKGVRVAAETSYNTHERKTKSFEITQVFGGGPAQVEEAKKVVQALDLQSDPIIDTLLRMRGSNGDQNALKRQSYTLNLTTEISNSFSVLLDVSIPACVNIESSLKIARTFSAKKNIEVDVLFEPVSVK